MKKIVNEVFVVNQPRKSIMSIVFVGKPSYPVPEEIHDKLYTIAQETDLFFIFHNSSESGINPDKFCNLYSGCGWMISGGTLSQTFLKSMEYSSEIFKCHSAFLVFNDLLELPNPAQTIEKAMTMNLEGIESAVFVPRRLKSEEMFKIYSKPEPKKLESVFGATTEDGLDKKYSIWTSESKALLIKRKMLDSFKGLGDEYINSFSWDDIRYFIASATKRALIGIIESEIETIDIKANGSEGKKSKVSK